MNYEAMFNYVTEVLEKSGNNKSQNELHSFRNRSEHIKRVFEWAKEIVYDFDNVDKDVLYTACLFHDIGYARGKQNHAESSAVMFKEYGVKQGFDAEFIERVAKIISLHSNKEMLNNPTADKELILLLEADLLDEEGALGIVWDLMAFGATHPESYYDTLNVLNIHSGHILTQDYMVTPKAKKLWDEKKQFVKEFIMEIENDLFLKEDKDGIFKV